MLDQPTPGGAWLDAARPRIVVRATVALAPEVARGTTGAGNSVPGGRRLDLDEDPIRRYPRALNRAAGRCHLSAKPHEAADWRQRGATDAGEEWRVAIHPVLATGGWDRAHAMPGA